MENCIAVTVSFDKIVNSVIFYVVLAHNKNIVKAKALIDTGAMHSAMAEWVARSLGLQEIGTAQAVYVKGKETLPIVRADLIFSKNVRFDNTDFIMTGDYSHAYDIIIGMDVLSKGDLSISNYGYTVFTFRTPSQITTKYSEDIITEQYINELMDDIIGL